MGEDTELRNVHVAEYCIPLTERTGLGSKLLCTSRWNIQKRNNKQTLDHNSISKLTLHII